MRSVKRWLVGGGFVVGVTVAFVLSIVVGMLIGARGGSVVPATLPGPTGSPTPIPTPVEDVTPSPSPSPTPTPTPSPTDPEPLVALFVGDSYTVGQRASSPQKRWSTRVARELGWTERNVADGGTGFVSRSPALDRLSYEEQLRSVRDPASVDIVLIAGGQNDFPELRTEPDVVFQAVADTYALAAQRFPGARIIAVGPSTPWEIGLEARALDSAVRAAAERHEATYVSMIDPDVVRDRFVDADGIHVNDMGYGTIARRVVSQIS